MSPMSWRREREGPSKWSFIKQHFNFLRHNLIRETSCIHNVPELYKTVIASKLKGCDCISVQEKYFLFHLQLQGKWTESCSKHNLCLVFQEFENKTVAVFLYLYFHWVAVLPLCRPALNYCIHLLLFLLHFCSTYLLIFTRVSGLIQLPLLMVFITTSWPSWRLVAPSTLVTIFISIDLCRVHIAIHPPPNTHIAEGFYTQWLSTRCSPQSYTFSTQSALIIRAAEPGGHSKQPCECFEKVLMCMCQWKGQQVLMRLALTLAFLSLLSHSRFLSWSPTTTLYLFISFATFIPTVHSSSHFDFTPNIYCSNYSKVHLQSSFALICNSF